MLICIYVYNIYMHIYIYIYICIYMQFVGWWGSTWRDRQLLKHADMYIYIMYICIYICMYIYAVRGLVGIDVA
jgi:hypothetical protein